MPSSLPALSLLQAFQDAHLKIHRPRQCYTGETQRAVADFDAQEHPEVCLPVPPSNTSRCDWWPTLCDDVLRGQAEMAKPRNEVKAVAVSVIGCGYQSSYTPRAEDTANSKKPLGAVLENVGA